MRYLRLLAVLGVTLLTASYVQAQRVVVGVGIAAPAPVLAPAYLGPAPVCAYGYYDYYPYACAPYGYYGPEWFRGGIFIGIGPWFHAYHGGPDYSGRYWRDRDLRGGSAWRPAPGARGPVFRPAPGLRGEFHGGAVRGGNAFHGNGAYLRNGPNRGGRR